MWISTDSLQPYHSLDIEYKDFLKKYDAYAKEQYSFLVFGTTLSCDDHLQFRKKCNKRRKKNLFRSWKLIYNSWKQLNCATDTFFPIFHLYHRDALENGKLKSITPVRNIVQSRFHNYIRKLLINPGGTRILPYLVIIFGIKVDV